MVIEFFERFFLKPAFSKNKKFFKWRYKKKRPKKDIFWCFWLLARNSYLKKKIRNGFYNTFVCFHVSSQVAGEGEAFVA